MSSLSGKTAVVTGGSRGIGRAISEIFAKNGADVAIIATRESDEAKEAVESVSSFGVKAKLYVCDVSKAEDIKTTAENIIGDFGKVDILVNNAGITRDNLLPSLSEDDIDAVIDVNLKGAIYTTRAFIRHFVKQRSGNVINLSSVVGLMGNKGQTNYAASKAGIIGFTKSVAKEYGKRNIRCNAIAPGYIRTAMTDELNEDQVKEIAGNIPLARLGETEDVAKLALFLAGDDSSYITGEVIKVDGGMYV